MDLSVPTKVSVVIAAYNAETFLRQTMESVLAQSLRDIEVIVVDDGSTDKTAEILHSFADPRLSVLRQKNTGVSAAYLGVLGHFEPEKRARQERLTLLFAQRRDWLQPRSL